MGGFIKKGGGRRVGEIFMPGGITVPRGALAIYGQRVAEADYPKLFGAIGHAYALPGDDLMDGFFRLPGGERLFLSQATLTPASESVNYVYSPGATVTHDGNTITITNATANVWYVLLSAQRSRDADNRWSVPFVTDITPANSASMTAGIGIMGHSIAGDAATVLATYQAAGADYDLSLIQTQKVADGAGVISVGATIAATIKRTGGVQHADFAALAGFDNNHALTKRIDIDPDAGTWAANSWEGGAAVGAVANVAALAAMDGDPAVGCIRPIYDHYQILLMANGQGSVTFDLSDIAAVMPAGYERLLVGGVTTVIPAAPTGIGEIAGADTHDHGGAVAGHALTVGEVPSLDITMPIEASLSADPSGREAFAYGNDGTPYIPNTITVSTAGGGGEHDHAITAANNSPRHQRVLYCIQYK